MKNKSEKNPEKGKILKVLIKIKNIFFAVILAVLALIIIVSVITRISGNSPSFFGYSVYRVSSESMKPELNIGDIILSQNVDPMTLKKGDIITYTNDEEGAPTSITHRVVEAPFEAEGKYYVRTKGDANPMPDKAVLVDKVDGVFKAKIPSIKTFYDFFITPWGLITLLALIFAAFFNEIIIFIRYLIGFKDGDKRSIEEIIERYKNEENGSDNPEEDLEKNKENSE